MKEKVFNLFNFVSKGTVLELGVVVHEISGSDHDKQCFLQKNVENDFPHSKNFQIPEKFLKINESRTLPYSTYTSLVRKGRALEIYEEIFLHFDASQDPLTCITSIVDGKPEIDLEIGHEPLYVSSYEDHPKLGLGKMDDFLEKYTMPEGFDIPALINDDYFKAIKLLFNNKHYVSCVKLLVSFIDTISFLEYGDQKDSFKNWLNTFADLAKIKITASQLWELRNSILHMSNLDSRKVLQGKEKRISFCIASPGIVGKASEDLEYFNLKDFMDVITQALSEWIQSMNQDPKKLTLFIERYDRIVSDNRQAITVINKKL